MRVLRLKHFAGIEPALEIDEAWIAHSHKVSRSRASPECGGDGGRRSEFALCNHGHSQVDAKSTAGIH